MSDVRAALISPILAVLCAKSIDFHTSASLDIACCPSSIGCGIQIVYLVLLTAASVPTSLTLKLFISSYRALRGHLVTVSQMVCCLFHSLRDVQSCGEADRLSNRERLSNCLLNLKS